MIIVREDVVRGSWGEGRGGEGVEFSIVLFYFFCFKCFDFIVVVNKDSGF